MIKKLIFVSAVLFSLNFYAQGNFKQGYYIDNDNVKKTCFILCEHWQNEPVRFIYKNAESEKAEIEMPVGNVKEFGVEGVFKFRKFDLLVDKSRMVLNRLSNHREPEWEKKTGFLRVIVEGDAILYEYRIQNVYKYFYSINNSPVEQLIYKEYLDSNGDVNKNRGFQIQLWSKVKCSSTTMERVRKLEYEEKKLSDYFVEVNNCGIDKKDSESDEIKSKSLVDKREKRKGNFLIKAKAGVGFNSLQLDFPDSFDVQGNSYPYGYQDFKFDGGKTYKVGFDLEYVFPTKKNNWSIFSELGYHSKYESNKKIPVRYYYPGDDDWNVSYSCLDFGLGFKYYMFLNNNSKLSFNVSANRSEALKSEAGNKAGYSLLIDNHPYFGFGLGYYYKKYSVEFKYSSRNILDTYDEIDSKYKDLSVVLGYTLFESNKKN